MNIKIKYGTVKTNKVLNREEFDTLASSKKLLNALTKETIRTTTKENREVLAKYKNKEDKARFLQDISNDARLKSELVKLIKVQKDKIIKDTQVYPVTFYRDIKGLGTFETHLNKGNKENLITLFKTASSDIKKQIQEKRNVRKIVPVYMDSFTQKNGDEHEIEKLGKSAIGRIIDVKTGKVIGERYINNGVYKNPGQILRILKWKHVKGIMTEARVPGDNKNYVGIEIEFYCKDVSGKKMAYDFYEEGLIKYLSLVGDGSIRPDAGYTGHELRILCEEDELEMVITKVSKILAKYDAKVNKSCGTHVHLDMRNRKRDVVFHNLVKAQRVLYKMNPKRRSTGEFSKAIEVADLAKAIEKYPENGGRHDRYLGINHHALNRHNTLEVRIHAGMIDKDKIINWAKLLVHIAHLPELTVEYKTVGGFFKKYSIPQPLQEYVTKRVEFCKEGEDNTEEVA